MNALAQTLPLWRSVEEVVLLGEPDDFKQLLSRLSAEADFPEEIRYGIESLYLFRSHYAAPDRDLSDQERQRVLAMDAEWALELLRVLHEREEEAHRRLA